MGGGVPGIGSTAIEIDNCEEIEAYVDNESSETNSETTVEVPDNSSEVRQDYADEVTEINIDIEPTYENAFKVCSLRNAIKIKKRAAMTDRAAAAELDRDFPIMSFEYYQEKYEGEGYHGTALWRRIMIGSKTPNEKFNTKYGVKKK
jgi:hypothetical protein